jgi:hypothetical protein
MDTISIFVATESGGRRGFPALVLHCMCLTEVAFREPWFTIVGLVVQGLVESNLSMLDYKGPWIITGILAFLNSKK